MMKWIFLITILFLFSCSRVDVAYDWAPRLTANFLDDQFDFSSERFNEVKKSLTNDFKNNKPMVKKTIGQHIDTILLSIEKKELTESELREFIKQLRASQKELVYSFTPTFKEVLSKITKTEMANFKESFDERWKKQKDRLDKFDQFKKRSAERFEDNMETYFDVVTDEQKKIYTEFIEQNYEFQKFQLAQRRTALSRFEEKFEQKEDLLDLTLKIYSNDDSIKSTEQKTREEEAINNTVLLIQKIWVSLTAEQKVYFKKTLNELKADIEQL